MMQFLNDDSSLMYGMEEPSYSPELEPMYSGLASGHTIRHYQKQNNIEEVTAGLSWGERLKAGATGLAHGLDSYGPEQMYRAMRTIGKIFGSDDLQAFATEGIDRELKLRELDPWYEVPEGWHQDGWGRSLYEGFRGLTSSAYAMLPGAAISLLPGGQVVGLATLGVGAGTMAGLAEYDSFMDEAFDKFSQLNPSLTRQDIEDAHFWDAFWSGLAEGGTEAVSDIVGGKLIGLVGKASVQPAKHILDQMVRNVTKTMITEVGGEVTTAVIQDYIREHAGLDYVGRVEAFKQTLGPALVGGAAFGVGGTGLKLAQGKIHAEMAANQNATGNPKAELDAHASEMQRQFREQNYSPKAVEAFNQATEAGLDYFQATTIMEAVEGTAKAWADRNAGKAADWQGDAAKLTDILKNLEAHKANPETTLAESLSSVRDLLLSELSADQRQALVDRYGTRRFEDGTGDPIINTDRLDADLRNLLSDPKSAESLPDASRPVLVAMRDSLLDLHGVATKTGLGGGLDADLSSMIQKAVDHRSANRPPKPSSFMVNEVDLQAVARKYGEFGKLTAEQQSAMIKDMAKATAINFDTWDLPVDQKALFGFLDTEMKPFLDKVMRRGERSNAQQEALAKASLEAEGINLDRFAEFASRLTGDGNLKESASVRARELMLAERIMLEKATDLAAIANETLAPSDVMKWQMTGAVYEQIHSMLRAVRSESGHLLNAWNFIKKDPDLARMRTEKLYSDMGGLEAARHKLTAFANAETSADRAGVLRDSIRAKTVNMFLEYRTMNLLSSLKTHVANLTGNAGMIISETLNRFTGEKMGMGKGIAAGETMAFINGMWASMRKVKEMWSTHKETKGGTLSALKDINGMWNNEAASSLIGDAGLTQRALTKDNALEVIGAAKEKMGLSREHGLISGGLSTMVDYMGRMLGISSEVLLAQDSFFKMIGAGGELAARNHREASRQAGGDQAKYQALMEKFSQKPPADHKKAALAFGQFVTFQTPLSGFTKAVDGMRHQYPLTRALVPFFRTPVNIMKYAARHTPGLASFFGDIRAELNSPDLATRHLAEARVMTGTFVWATVLGMAAEGYLTGNGPTDPEEKEKARAAGWQPNSLHIGDTYIALDRLDPAAFLLNTAASLVEIYDSMEGDDLDKAMWSGFAAAFRVASERTYLKSIADAFDAVTDWEGRKGDMARRGLFTSMVPGSSFLRSATQAVDPIQREVDGIFDAIRSGIPGASEALPVRRNFLGEAITSDGYYGPDWLSPLRQSHDKHDPVYDEIHRLSKAGYKIPSMPDRHIRHKGQTVKMSGQQYSDFLELSGVGLKYGGKNAKEKLAEVIQSKAYQGWTDEQKQTRIKAVIESYRKAAKDKMKTDDQGIRYLLGIQ